jgi:membrane protein YdbS with pleckstrin-like domain
LAATARPAENSAAVDLLPDETLIARVHRHWIVPFRGMAIAAVAVLATLVLDAVDRLPAEVRVLLTLLVLAAAGLWAIVTWVRWTSTSYTLTDVRVVFDSGVLTRASKAVPLDRVQDVSLVQPPLGRLLGYGRVTIDAAGSSGGEALDDVPEPGRFRDLVFEQVSGRRRAPWPTSV